MTPRDSQGHGIPENGKLDPYKLPISLGIRRWESHYWVSLKIPLVGAGDPKMPTETGSDLEKKIQVSISTFC